MAHKKDKKKDKKAAKAKADRKAEKLARKKKQKKADKKAKGGKKVKKSSKKKGEKSALSIGQELKLTHCTCCKKHCPLSKPKCSKGRKLAAALKAREA